MSASEGGSRWLLGGLVVGGLVVANVLARWGDGRAPALPVAAVRGTVTYRGTPLNGGLVKFTAADPDDPVGQANGMIARDGSYGFSGVPVGRLRVSVDTSVRPAEDYAWRPGSPGPKPVYVPARYADPARSGLTLDVGPGEHTHDIRID